VLNLGGIGSCRGWIGAMCKALLILSIPPSALTHSIADCINQATLLSYLKRVPFSLKLVSILKWSKIVQTSKHEANLAWNRTQHGQHFKKTTCLTSSAVAILAPNYSGGLRWGRTPCRRSSTVRGDAHAASTARSRIQNHVTLENNMYNSNIYIYMYTNINIDAFI